MMAGAGLDGSVPRAVERGRSRLCFADGGTLELGRRTAVMGVLNVTPDSFSDGGRFDRLPDALEAARQMVDGGADLIDVGGESSRPGASSVNPEEEVRRIVPVIEAIKRETNVRLSVDTTKAWVARRALDAGADLVNDVSALGDPEMLPLLAERNTPVVLMHMRGTPASMQSNTQYDDLWGSVLAFLEQRVGRARDAGLPDDRIVVDPGIGFGKSAEGNLELLRRIPDLVDTGRPVLIGASRKAFIGSILEREVDDRLHGSLAVAAFAATQGAHIVRVHDVPATMDVVRMVDAIGNR